MNNQQQAQKLRKEASDLFHRIDQLRELQSQFSRGSKMYDKYEEEITLLESERRKRDTEANELLKESKH
jgi:predicted  nucleic acid-binding Zn-ribbon protein